MKAMKLLWRKPKNRQRALQAMCEGRESYAAARSENWQESERGEEFAERLAAFQEVMNALEELTSAPEKTRMPLDG